MTAGPFFRPSPHWVGDVIPVEHEGVLHLYYLHECRTAPKPGTPWHLVTTEDLVTYVDHGEVLPHGGPDSADRNAYTGSVVTDDDGLHHLFYTGQNPARTGPDGRPLQLVMHATGADLHHWTKHPEHTLPAPAGYDGADWRDPFVHRPDPDGPWEMILAARRDHGPERRRGVVARLTSPDLETWTLAEPLWDPRRFLTQECPEVFRIGEWWYLVYSEFTDAFVTRYRMSRGPHGPWHAPARDTLDGRAFYAAKSAELRGRRILVGWIATREGCTDDGAWQWAGTMSALEAVQNPDGTLAVRIPREVLDQHGPMTPDPDAVVGDLAVHAPTGYAAAVREEVLADAAVLSIDLEIDEGTRSCGVLLRTDPTGEVGYVLRLEPTAGRMVLDRWPRPVHGGEQWEISGHVPHILELERPADLSGKHHHLDIVLDGDILVAGLDGQVVLSTRLYDHRIGRLGCFAQDGSMRITSLATSVPRSVLEGETLKRSQFLSLAAAGTTLPLLSSCGGSSGPAPSTSALVEGPITPRPIAWLLSRPVGGGVIQVMTRISEEYAQEHPGFSLELITTPDRPSYLQKLKTLATADMLPELFDTDATPYAATLAAQGRMIDVQELLTDLGILEDFRPAALEYQRFADGGLFMIPLEFGVEYFWYDEGQLDAAGVAVPETLEEMPDLSAQLAASGTIPLAVAGKDLWPLERYIAYVPFRRAGEDYIADLVRGDAAFSDETGRAAATWISDLGAAGAFAEGFSSVGYADAQGQFTSQRAAMYNIGTWELPHLATAALPAPLQERIGFFPLPITQGAVTGLDECTAPSGIGVAVNSRTYDPLVRDFLAFALERYPGLYAESGLLGPTRREPVIPETALPLYEEVLTAADSLGEATLMPWDTQLDPTTDSRLQQELVLLAQGDASVEDFVQVMDDTLASDVAIA